MEYGEKAKIVLSDLDIIDVISHYCKVNETKAISICSCPFCKGKQNTMAVNKMYKEYKCFGCGEGGNLIDFVSKIEGVAPHIAVDILIKRYDLELLPLGDEDESYCPNR